MATYLSLQKMCRRVLFATQAAARGVLKILMDIIVDVLKDINFSQTRKHVKVQIVS